jgi:putative tricarboxylic transport membrane protein
MMKARRIGLTLAAMLLIASTVAGCAGAKSTGNTKTPAGGSTEAKAAGPKYPTKPLELVAAGSPGGGLDTASRVLDEVAKKEKTGVSFVITNKEGGGGNVARAYLVEKKNDDYILLYESNRVWLNNLMGTTQYSIEDTTPIARLTTEYEAWAVKVDSPYKSADQIFEALKKDPNSVKFGIGTIPSDDQFNVLRPIMAKGIDATKVKLTAFRSGGDLMTNLLGGHVDVISTSVSEAIAQAQAGKVRILSVSAGEKLKNPVVKDVPAWKDLGIDVVIPHWRGVFGTPGMSADTLKFWDDFFAKLVKTQSWKDSLAKMDQEDAYLNSTDFKASLIKEREVNKPLVLQFAGSTK